MDAREWEFLDKQTRRQRPVQPPTSTIILMLLVIFVAGLTTGALVFPPEANQFRPAKMARRRWPSYRTALETDQSRTLSK
jgi:hypothetical protein